MHISAPSIGNISVSISKNNFKIEQTIKITFASRVWEAAKAAFFALAALIAPCFPILAKRRSIHWHNFKSSTTTFEALVDKDFVFTEQILSGALFNVKAVAAELKKKKEFIDGAKREAKNLEAKKIEALKSVEENGENLKNLEPHFWKDKHVALLAIKRAPSAFKYLDSSLRSNKDFIRTAVEIGGIDVLKDVDKKLSDDKKFVLSLVQINGKALNYASERLKQDREIVLAAINQCALALEFADWGLKNDEEIVLTAIKRNGEAIRYASLNMCKNRTIVLAAVKDWGPAFNWGDSFWQDKEIAIEAAAHGSKDAVSQHRKDRDVALAAIRAGYDILESLSDELRDDKELVKEAVRYHDTAYKNASSRLQQDRDVIKEVLTHHGYMWRLIPHHRDDLELFELALKSFGCLLEDAPPHFKQDPKRVMAAVQINGAAFQYADPVLKADRDIALAALKKGASLAQVDPVLRLDEEFVLEALKIEEEYYNYHVPGSKENLAFALKAVKHINYYFVLKWGPDALKDNEEFFRIAVGQDFRALKFASERLRADKEFALHAVRQYGRALQFVADPLKESFEVVEAAVKNDPSSIRFADKSLHEHFKEVRLADDLYFVSIIPKYVGNIIAEYSAPLNMSFFVEHNVLSCKINYEKVYAYMKSITWLLSKEPEAMNKRLGEIRKREFYVYQFHSEDRMSRVSIDETDIIPHPPYYDACQELFKNLQVEKAKSPLCFITPGFKKYYEVSDDPFFPYSLETL